MTGEELLRKLELADPAYVRAAAEVPAGRRHPRLRRTVLAAACVCLLASAAAVEGEAGVTIRIGTLLAMGFGLAFPALGWFLRWRKRCKARPPKPERKIKKPKGHPPEEPPTEKPAA